ncbi:TniB family NTP-binding protein [Celeribacter halophilus]|uniref:TniB family NTP-binding protein n=1 Tax=Celeribacter halophilus TaxID=576117 RepID=UPI003A8D9242
MLDQHTAEHALEALRELHIGTDRDAEAASHIERLFEKDAAGNRISVAKRFTKTRETRGVMVVGDPGSGKSHLVNRTLEKLPMLQPRDDGTPRYISCVVPSPATFKSMMGELLKQAGYPVESKRQEAWSLFQDLRYRLALLEISVIWIDEAQDLFCADRNLILRALKSLMQGEYAVTIVVSGTQALAEVIRSDQQVKRRFTSIVLPDLTEQSDGDNFREVMAHYCQRVGVHAPVEADLVGRVFHGARYCFGRAIELLLLALEFVIEGEDTHLEIGHFASAYAMLEACPVSENVFFAEQYWLIETDPEAVEVPRRTFRKRKV